MGQVGAWSRIAVAPRLPGRIGMVGSLTRSNALRLGSTMVASVVVAACGGSAAPPSPTPAPVAPALPAPTAQPTPAPIATKAPVPVLHWFGYAPPHRFGMAQKAVLDDFMAKNPGRIALEVGESSANVQLAKIKIAVAAGTPPTMWFGWQVEASDLWGSGALVDLNAELSANKDWGRNRADLIPSLLSGAEWKGKLTLVPMFADPNILGFNRKLLADAGLPLPADRYTWEKWLEIGRKAASPPDRVLGQFIYNWSSLQWWGFSNGVVPLNAERTKVQFTAPALLATLEWLDQNVTRGLLRNGPGDFDLGKTLTEVVNPGAITPPRYPNVDPGDGSGIFATHYPIGPDNLRKEPITAGNVFGFMAFKGAKGDATLAAAEIAAWSVRPDVQLLVAQASSNPPSNTTAARDPALAKVFNDHPIRKALNDQARFGYPTPNFPSWGKVTAMIDETLARLAKGELRPKDALADIQAKAQPMIDTDLEAG